MQGKAFKVQRSKFKVAGGGMNIEL